VIVAMSQSKACILITGVGGASVGHQVLSALLPLRERYRLVTADADQYSCGLFQGDEAYRLPLATAPGYLAAVLRLIAKERIQVLIPGTEAEARVLAGHLDALRHAGCVPLIHPAEVIDLCHDKTRMNTWLSEHGFSAPLSASGTGWPALARACGWPIVAKPSVDSSGSKNVAILKDEADVESYLRMQADPERTLFQQYVGDKDSEYTVGVLTHLDGTLVDSIVMRRRLFGMTMGQRRSIEGREYALSTGFSQGVIVREPMVQDVCERLTLALGMKGAANIQCRVHQDRVLVFEVHARFSGTTSIRAQAGFNEPDVLIRNALFGERFERLPYQVDVAAIRYLQADLVPLERLNRVPAI
jgi:carbamoyl-phosphate synthase large subunit